MSADAADKTSPRASLSHLLKLRSKATVCVVGSSAESDQDRPKEGQELPLQVLPRHGERSYSKSTIVLLPRLEARG